MQLTKENLIDAHEQGLVINTRNGNLKIVAILNDIYGVTHFNSNIVKWWMFENFERNEAKIEQPKPKLDLSILKEGEIYFAKSKSKWIFKLKKVLNNDSIRGCHFYDFEDYVSIYEGGLNMLTELRLPTEPELELFYSKFPELKPKPKYNGRAVKCDTVEQLRYIATKCNSIYLHAIEHNFKDGFNYYELINDTYRHKLECIEKHIEIISFSQYCTENDIVEPKWIKGFEVGKDYNDVVMVSDNNKNWEIEILNKVKESTHPFICNRFSFKYCRYLTKEEINEIKFSN